MWWEVDVGSELEYLVTAEVAKRLRVKAQTLRKWRVEGRGPIFHKFGGRVCYHTEDIRQWEAANRRTPEGPKTGS